MHSANKILCMIFFLLPPSLTLSVSLPCSLSLTLSHFLAEEPSKESVCGDGFSSCGLRECAVHNSSHGAGRQAGSSPSLSLACLPDSPALDSFMCSLFWGFSKLKHSAPGKIVRGVSEGMCVSVCVQWKIVRNSDKEGKGVICFGYACV